MAILEDRIILISGVGPVLGAGIAQECARHGAQLILGSRSAQSRESVARDLEGTGLEPMLVEIDVTSEESCEDAIRQIVKRFGRLDVLVNNAFNTGEVKPFMEADFDKWRTAMDTNFFGTLNMTRAAVPALGHSSSGRVIMINTMSTSRIQRGWGAYAGSKGALQTVTKTLALELGELGIRVNGVHPGFIYGDSVEAYIQSRADAKGVTFQDEYDLLAAETCLGYLAKPEEIAGSVVFLASDLSTPVTGQMFGANVGHVFNG